MTDILLAVSEAWQATSKLEFISVLAGLAYIILAARENIWCWPAALIGTATAIFVFWDVNLFMESALNVYYLIMAMYGWWHWQYGGRDDAKLQISSWNKKHHLLAIAGIMLMTLLSGATLSASTEAALPYADSFTTWSAVLTTWMVARKILENWLYWIVIDTVSIWLYLERGLFLYALLFLAYTIIAVFGYMNWRQHHMHATS
ncbi:MAG: nicotinamide riboside transporter PnuC [Arenicella sp.]|nr:nicotinamide riboside transporter PnuC [Arenicella sp.]